MPGRDGLRLKCSSRGGGEERKTCGGLSWRIGKVEERVKRLQPMGLQFKVAVCREDLGQIAHQHPVFQVEAGEGQGRRIG